MDTISREQAAVQGLRRYFTGVPCIHGHVSERAVANGRCLECHRIEANRRYHSSEEAAEVIKRKTREWYSMNRDRADESHRRWRRENRDRHNQTAKQWRQRNPELVREMSRRNYEQMRAKEIARQEEELGRRKTDTCECCGKRSADIIWDHDHKTGHGRGWICQACNFALGHSGDDPVRLQQLVRYLLRHKARMEAKHGEDFTIMPLDLS